MSLLYEIIHRWRKALTEDFTVTALKTAIVLWALLVIVLVLFVINNKWLLAGIFLYEVLP